LPTIGNTWTLGATMQDIRQYDVFTLAKDINPAITKGMKGVILEIWAVDSFEVEFVKKDATNYEYKGQATFTIDGSYIGEVTWRAT
jgi:hypothetical protein